MGKTLEETKSRRDKAFIILNQCKWAAAQSFCQKNGFVFRVMTEADLFHTGNRFASKPAKPKVPKKRAVRK